MRNEISKKVTNAQLAKKFRDLCNNVCFFSAEKKIDRIKNDEKGLNFGSPNQEKISKAMVLYRF